MLFFKKIHYLVIGIFCSLCYLNVYAYNINTQYTESYFNRIKSNPTLLYLFIKNFPKGADLHNHLAGAVYAENIMYYGVLDKDCLDQNNLSVDIACTLPNDIVMNNANLISRKIAIIKAWSMFSFVPGTETSFTHFFNTFDKFMSITDHHRGDILALVAEKAARNNIEYLELQTSPYLECAIKLGNELSFSRNLNIMFKQMNKLQVESIIKNINSSINYSEMIKNRELKCGAENEALGCKVLIKYQYSVLRNVNPTAMFSQLYVAFNVANENNKFVGINVVGPEFENKSLRYYLLQMHYINYFHLKYPNVKISLHAGELTPQLVPYKDLRFHIDQALFVANANRIGHGSDIAYETNSHRILSYMARKHIPVEICLTSNKDILNLSGKSHPISIYEHYDVPIVLATDDQGILRTNISHEYFILVKSYHFTYPELKQIVRNSLTYSFLPGKSIWQNDYNHSGIVAECKGDVLGANLISPSCRNFLADNLKAAYQWNLENELRLFELKYSDKSNL